MNRAERKLRLQQLDRLLGGQDRSVPPAPLVGWIKTLRLAQGLTLDDLAQRLGLSSRTTAHQLEHAETDGTITLRRLRAAADALGCDLAIFPVPRRTLSTAAEASEEAEQAAMLAKINHSMALEGQAIPEERLRQIGLLAAEERKHR